MFRSKIDIQIDEILERLKRVSPAPWEAYSAMCCPDMGGISGKHKVCEATVGRYGHPMDIEDAEFCAHARSDIPDLLQEIFRLRAALERANDNLEQTERDLYNRINHLERELEDARTGN